MGFQERILLHFPPKIELNEIESELSPLVCTFLFPLIVPIPNDP